MKTTTKALILLVVVLLVLGGTVYATTVTSNVLNTGSMLIRGETLIKPNATPPANGSLINALNEAGFYVDEDGNVNVPNSLTFGGSVPASFVVADENVTWAHGVVNVTAAGAWIDSHPVEEPTGASCSILSPHDEYPIGEIDVALTSTNRNLGIASVYRLQKPSFCELTKTGGNAVSCVVEKVGSTFYLRALRANGTTASSVTGARATWKAHITKLNPHQYTCGIVRNPGVETSSILEWKIADLEASRLPDDQFFVFVKDETGAWFNEGEMCLNFGCILPPYITEGHYQGLQVAWFIWKVEEAE